METTYRLTQTGKQVQDLLDQVTPNEQAIANEQQRAEAAEQQLQTNINNEQQARIDDVDAEEVRAKAAEQQLQENIDSIGQGGSAAVTAERERAEAAEQQLQQNINAEESARIADEIGRAHV